MRTNHRYLPASLLAMVCSLVALGSVSHADDTATGKTQQLSSPDQVPEGLAKSDWSSIREAYEAGRHAFQSVEGGWQARNPGQQWTTKFDGRGFLAQPKDADWQWGLEFKSYGFGERQTEVGGTPAVRNEGQRLSYQWDDSVQEWFVNDSRGLEHGFTITRRPDACESCSGNANLLSFTLATRGGLRPSISSDALTVHFRDASHAPVLNYSGLKVWDADGVILASRFEAVGENQIRLLVEEAGARYPLTIDPIAQQAYLKASNTPIGTKEYDKFGWSVAISGELVVVGAPYEGSGSTGVNSSPDENASQSGAAYVFVKSQFNTWYQEAYLKASNTGTGDRFGNSVAISGNTVVIGAPYENSSTTGVNSIPNEGAAVSGAAYVFQRSGFYQSAIWSQQAYLKASNTGEVHLFGHAVAISGDTIVVGSPGETSSSSGVNSTPSNYLFAAGASYVFVRSVTTWSQQAYLKAANPGDSANFGLSVSVHGDSLVIGAPKESSGATGVNSTPVEGGGFSGAAYVFLRSNGTWTQQAYLKASNTGALDRFGQSVSISGDTVAIGAISEDSSTSGVNSTPNDVGIATGAVYVFLRTVGVWTQQAFLKASNTADQDQFGYSVSISEDTIVVGAPYEEESGDNAADAGAAYVFIRSGATWTQQAYLKATNRGAGDWFGMSVAISSDLALIGAANEDGDYYGASNFTFFENSSTDSGASYLYSRSSSSWSQQLYVKGPRTETDDRFGDSVAISGDTVVVGATFEDSGTAGVNGISNESLYNSGAAYVFVRSAGTWSQQAFLKASNPGLDDQFGWSVGISGDSIVVGARNEDSSTTGVNSLPNESRGNSGAAYVFVRSSGLWSQQAYLKAPTLDQSGSFGHSVAISGDTLIVSCLGESSNTTGVNSVANKLAAASGAAFVFVRQGGNWSQEAYLKASNTGAGDSFGISVAISENTVVVGAYYEDSSTSGVNSSSNETATSAGAAYVFGRNAGVWSQQAYLKASNSGAGDQFGACVAVSGNTVVVGASSEDSGTTGVNSIPNELARDSGAAYVFTKSLGIWTQQAYLKASNTEANDGFGTSVAVSGETLAVGASRENSSSTGVNSIPNDSLDHYYGAAYVFVQYTGTWSQQAYLKASNTDSGDYFGWSVAVSGDTVVVGALGEDGGATGVNNAVTEMASNSGAVYVFTGLGPVTAEPAIDTPVSTSVSASTAVLGGTVTNDGGAMVAERGVVFAITSANPDPQIGGVGVIKVTVPGTIGIFTASISDLIPGTSYLFKAYATNSMGTSYTSAGAFTTVTVASELATWATTAGLSGGNTAPAATPFNDGVPNLIKYAFNMNPAGPDVTVMTAGGTAGLPQIAVDTNGAEPILRVAFLRRKGSGLIYTPQRSDSLGTFQTMIGTQTVTSIDAQWERVTVQELSPPASITSSFARVAVRLP